MDKHIRLCEIVNLRNFSGFGTGFGEVLFQRSRIVWFLLFYTETTLAVLLDHHKKVRSTIISCHEFIYLFSAH